MRDGKIWGAKQPFCLPAFLTGGHLGTLPPAIRRHWLTVLGVYGPVIPPIRRVANWSCRIFADSGPRPNKHGGVIGQKGGHVTVT